MKMRTGFDGKIVTGEMPCFSAVASTNGLNEEPGCRSPCTARLNWLCRKLSPPYMARISPVRGQRRRRSVRFLQHALNRAPRELLQAQVDRRLHVEAAAEHASCPVLLDQLLLHVVDEVGRRPLDARQTHVRRSRQRGACRTMQIACGDVAL